MRFEKDRCLQCGTPARPTNLKSNYEELDERGTFTCTDYWFCSDECYKEAYDEYVLPEYKLKYYGKQNDKWGFEYLSEHEDKLPPKLKAKLKAQYSDFMSVHGDLPIEYCASTAFDEIAINFMKEQRDMVNNWTKIQLVAISVARTELRQRIFDEWSYQDDKESEAYLRNLESQHAAFQKESAELWNTRTSLAHQDPKRQRLFNR